MDYMRRTRTTNNPEMTKGDRDDLISKLPDGILTDILSLLDSKEAVQTCVLSKRWCKLWTFVPCLCISSDDFRRTSESDERETDEEVLERFENFVSSFLRLRDNATDLHSLTLWHTKEQTLAQVSGSAASTWVLYAAKHNPKKLDINLYGDDQIYWPDCLFTCESLEVLSLNYEIFDERLEIEPDKVFLPKLTDLSLIYAFISGASMETLLSGCPALEDLYIIECTLEMKSISFQTVINLGMINCNFVSDAFPSAYIPISAPRAKCLKFRAQIDTAVRLEDMPMLTEAKITTDFDDDLVSNYTLELLSGLYSVKNLRLNTSVYLKELLQTDLPRCPKFYNLKNMSIHTDLCMRCHFRLLSSFLEHCPNLEYLTLSHNEHLCEDEHGHEEQGQNCDEIKNFFCNRLRKIHVFYTSDDNDVDGLIALLQKSTMSIPGVRITKRAAPVFFL